MRRDGLEMLRRRMNECYYSVVRREEKEGLKKETIALFICGTKKALENAMYVKGVSISRKTMKTSSNFALVVDNRLQRRNGSISNVAVVETRNLGTVLY